MAVEIASVNEAFAIAEKIAGSSIELGVEARRLRSLEIAMETLGYSSVKNQTTGELMYFYRMATEALDTGVKAYPEVVEVAEVATTESGIIKTVTVNTVGVGINVATKALAVASAAATGYNIGSKIYETNPTFWDILLEPVDEYLYNTLPEGAVNAIVKFDNVAQKIRTFSLLDVISNVVSTSLSQGAYSKSIQTEFPIGSSFTVVPHALTVEFIQSCLKESLQYANNAKARNSIQTLYNNAQAIYNDAISLWSNYNSAQVDVVWSPEDLGSGRANIYIRPFNISSTQKYTYYGAGIYTDTYGNKYANINSSIFHAYGMYSALNSTYYGRRDTGGNNQYPVLGKKVTKPYWTHLSDSFYITYGCLNSVEKGLDGTSLQDGATYPSSGSTIPQTYPDWDNNKLVIHDVGGDASSEWYPLSIDDTDPETEGDPQTQTQAQSGEETKPYTPNIVIDIPNPPANPTSYDDGDTPPYGTGTSGVTGIAGVYNPTQSEINSFANWLWSDSIIDQVLRVFTNPLDAVIGLHFIYATPHIGSRRDIGVGYINSQVEANVVDEQYITIDCGTKKIPSYYNNVNDWSPYTSISCYLPFIGIVKLNVDDLIGANLNITYKIDVLTGTCLAMLKVSRDNMEGVLYQYNGNCAVQLPLTTGTYGSAILGNLGLMSSIGFGMATMATGGSALVAGAGIASGLGGAMAGNLKHDVNRSGAIGSNAGAMGIKTPYLIIERPYSKYADGYNKYIGYPSNHTVTLSSCSGYTRISEVNLNNITCTDEEKAMIDNALKTGIFV